MAGEDRVDIEVRGVVIEGCSVMDSRYSGYDTETEQRFPAGTRICYKAGRLLTPVQRKACFPTGKGNAVTVVYDSARILKAAQTPQPMRHAKQPAKQKEDLYAKSMTVPPKAAPVAGAKRSARPYTPSPFQQAIRQTLLDTESHILIDAKAGSGKTETLVWLIDSLYDAGLLDVLKVVFFAFNTHIREELTLKLSGTGVPAYTSHAFGFMLLKKRFGQGLELSRGKWLSRQRFVDMICDMNALGHNAEGYKEAKKCGEYKSVNAVLDLAEKMKNWAVFPELVGDRWMFSPEQRKQCLWFVKKYEIEFPKEMPVQRIIDWACDVVARSIPLPGTTPTKIEFDDMLYLPLMLDLPVPYFDIVLTDESQDFNRAQTLMLERLTKATKEAA